MRIMETFAYPAFCTLVIVSKKKQDTTGIGALPLDAHEGRDLPGPPWASLIIASRDQLSKQ